MRFGSARALTFAWSLWLFSSLTPAASADEGMWTFNRLPKAELNRRHGFVPSADWVEHLQRSSVRVSGCSGSFVSSSGLTLTNHHCAEDCLSRLSTANRDFIKLGFSATSLAEEITCPGYEIHQLTAVSDVTSRVNQATQGLSGEPFHRAFSAERARIEEECRTSDEVQCDVVSLYHGGLYELYRYRRYKDVRVVFAPEAAIAFFGGDPDNFNFPRYDLDITFLRAYDGGKPAATPDHLRIATSALDKGDLTFTSGNPGSTERLRTLAELEYLRDHVLVDQLLSLARYRGFLVEYGKRNAEAERVAKSELFGVENSFKALRGEHRALLQPSFFQKLAQAERNLRERVAADPELQPKYGGAWDAIAQAQAALQAMEPDLTWVEGGNGGRPAWAKTPLYSWARSLVRAAAELSKPGEQRLEEFAPARMPALTQRLLAERPLNRSFEIAKLAFGLSQLREELGTDHPYVKQVLGKASPDELAMQLVEGTELGNSAQRKRLLEGGAAALAASQDPMIRLATQLDPVGRELRRRYQSEVEPMIRKNSELVAKARFAVYGMDSYPDATFSPRVSYGTVRGWFEGTRAIPPFTTIGGAFERATGRDPYALPKSWTSKRASLNESLPFNFVTDNDIIGGNSGSPVVNRAGELVGLVFDGNIHSLGGAYGFDGTLNRMVAVDARAILHALDVVYAAKRVHAELTDPAGQ